MARRIVIFGWAESEHIQRWTAGLAERGCRIKLISLGGEPLPGIETVVLPRRGKLSYLLQSAAAVREARAFQPDLVHVHYAAGFGVWAARVKHPRTIVSAWGSDILMAGRNPLYRFFTRRAIRMAAAVTATSEFLRTATAALDPQAAVKTTVIPFGVTRPDRLTPLPPGPLKVLFLKKHRAVYGPEILLQAIARARRSVPDLSLTMAGEGPLTESLKRQAVDLGVDDCVRFAGQVPHAEVSRLLSEHHLLAMPSRSESFGVAALEAAACGRPTVATRVGGIPEVVDDGVSGLLVAPGAVDQLAEALVRLAGEREMLAAMGEAARKLAEERFDWQRSLDMMTALYDRVLA